MKSGACKQGEGVYGGGGKGAGSAEPSLCCGHFFTSFLDTDPSHRNGCLRYMHQQGAGQLPRGALEEFLTFLCVEPRPYLPLVLVFKRPPSQAAKVLDGVAL